MQKSPLSLLGLTGLLFVFQAEAATNWQNSYDFSDHPLGETKWGSASSRPNTPLGLQLSSLSPYAGAETALMHDASSVGFWFEDYATEEETTHESNADPVQAEVRGCPLGGIFGTLSGGSDSSDSTDSTGSSLGWQDFDDFNDNSLNTSKWATAYFNGGDDPSETNGRIEFKSSGVSVSAASKIPPGWATLLAEDDETDPNNLLYVQDSNVYGIEADITLPAGSTMGAAIYLQILDLSPFAGVEAELMYDGSGVKFWFENESSEEEITKEAVLGTTYKLAVVHENNKNTIYLDDKMVAEFSATNFSVDSIGIGAFHDEGGAYTVYADNIRVMSTSTVTSDSSDSTDSTDTSDSSDSTLDWQDYDDFSDNSLDTSKWDAGYFSGGQTAVEANGMIELKGGAYTGNDPTVLPQDLLPAAEDSTEGNAFLFAQQEGMLGIEAEITLPSSGNSVEAGVFIDMFDSSPLGSSGIELAYRPSGVNFSYDYLNAAGQELEGEEAAALDTKYRVAVVHSEGKTTFYVDGETIQEFDQSFTPDYWGIGAFNDNGDAFTASVDNVKVISSETVTATETTQTATTSYAPSSLAGKIYSTKIGECLQFLTDTTATFHYPDNTSPTSFQANSEIADVTYTWIVTGSNSGTLTTNLDETTTLTFTSETGGSYDWQETGGDMETDQGSFTLSDASSGYAPADLAGDSLAFGDNTYVFKENGVLTIRDADSSTDSTYGFVKTGDNSAVLAVPAQAVGVTSTLYKIAYSSTGAGSFSEGATDAFTFFADGTGLPSTQGWLWFDAYPWVYSSVEGGWLYFYPSNGKLYAYSVNDEVWREMTASE